MRVDCTPFSGGWWGQGLINVRPRVGTYGCYPLNNLPDLPFELRGDFEWLARQPSREHSIGVEKAAENTRSLAKLLAEAGKNGHLLPPEFVAFFGKADLQQRVRSCTDCYLDLSPVGVASPVGDGFLVRFLADSQGCVFWYLYHVPGSEEHCVVASPDFYGAGEEQWQTEPASPDQITFCEESFERFLCRFWLENEIWYSEYEKQTLSPEGRRYLESYGGRA